MRGAIPPLSQYIFMERYLVKHNDEFTRTKGCMYVNLQGEDRGS